MANNTILPVANPLTGAPTVVGPQRVAIPEPGETQESHRDTLVALKHAVEVLTRQRGPVTGSSVSFADLVNLGLISHLQVPGK